MEPPSERIAGAVSAFRAAVRRGSAQTAAIVVVLGLIFAAVALAVRIPGQGLLPGLPRLTQSEYSAGALGPLAPISEDYARHTLGDAAYGGLAGAGEPAPAVAGTLPRPARPASAPAGPGEAPPAPTIEGSPGVLPGLSPGGWVLTLAMVADSSTVQAGDELTYRMIIRNVGTEDFRGRNFTLEWHTPVGTVATAAGPCDLLLNVDVQGLCANVLVPQPGLGDANHEQRDSRGLITIRAGQQWVQEWQVQVPPGTPAGTQYTTHAHLSVSGSDQAITTDPVTVTVVE